ncbi:MAG: cupin domain-containing protein [Deltaproteobacteria bacterium]|nr:cupin domain-containing protein [Deltaproteobacteria bacterium]MBW2053641.1 cupin domain-containing protein [Deltaproteobacteria bacterium]MBW2142562.1 cupin domain-containing protein [Deltaproteobacteria bacterium]
MLIKDVNRIEPFTAIDGCLIKEIIQPGNDLTSPGISLAQAELAPGKATLPHRLDFLEIYFIMIGNGLMHVGEESAEVKPGQAIYIPPGEIQFIENLGSGLLTFLCVCHPGYDPGKDEVIINQVTP